MAYYFVKLVPPRPDFAQTMSEKEMAAMQAHGAYWREKARGRVPVVVGLVADPKGFYGMGVLEVSDEAELKTVLDADPVVLADIGSRYETYPLPRGVIMRA